MDAQIAQLAIGKCGVDNGNSANRNAQMSAQIMQVAVGTAGFYNGNNTNSGVQTNTRVAHIVMGGGGLYNGSSTKRNTQTNAQMAQTVMGIVGTTMATSPTVLINSESARSAKTVFDDRRTGRSRNNNGPTSGVRKSDDVSRGVSAKWS